MFKMTGKQIDEINELLVEHSEALTGFYDEGYNQGLRHGIIAWAAASLFGLSTTIVVHGINDARRKKLN
jgi:hypothetical protein